MNRFCVLLTMAVLLVGRIAGSAACAEISEQFMREFEQMKKDLDDLRKNQLAAQTSIVDSRASMAMDNKYGPNQDVYTKTGKLRIGALLQCYYYGFQNRDSRGLFDDPNGSGIIDQNNGLNNNGFRNRRTELHFQMDMTENVTSYVFIDPAREQTSFPYLPVNQGFFKRVNNIAPEFAGKSPGLNSTSAIAGIQSGAGTTNRMLQDAWIDYHDALPHHDFMIGQFHPWLGDDGIKSARELDFVERSQIGFIGDSRDLGASVHGAWWDVDDKAPAWSPAPSGRFQYWIAVSDGAGTFHSAGAFQNRPDDNAQKDVGYRVLVRPTWKDEKWGSAELGMSSQVGKHGGAGNLDPITDPVIGLNRRKTWAYRHEAWAYYAPGSIAKGWWMRGEWAEYHDRVAPGAIEDLTGGGDNPKAPFAQDNPHPFTSQGWFVSTGYKLADSAWNRECGGMPSWLRPFELTFKYDTLQDVQIADPANSGKTLLRATNIWTSGVNYYIKGHNAKIQFNYNVVDYPASGRSDIKFHQTNGNNFIMNFQVAF